MKLSMNIPNFLSIIRIILIPLFLYFIFVPSVEMGIWALVVFCVASLTDLFDGWSARKLKQETDFGKFLDPLADKFLVISALIAFLILDQLIPMWMILIIIFRDLLITFMRYLAIKKDQVLRTTKFGKVKTAFQMISIIVIITVFIFRGKAVDLPLEVLSVDDITKFSAVYKVYSSGMKDRWLIIAPYCLMAIVTLLTALSGLRYIITNRSLFLPSRSDGKSGPGYMRLKEMLFTGLYTGYCPVGSGTAGALLAMLVYVIEYYVFGEISWAVNLIVVAVMIYPSIKLGDSSEVFFQKNDPPEVVLDEIMGYWISVLFYPFSWKIAVLAFILFRIADIIKPYPANRAQRARGGLGIMMDDFIAGIYANIAVFCVLLFFRLAGMKIY